MNLLFLFLGIVLFLLFVWSATYVIFCNIVLLLNRNMQHQTHERFETKDVIFAMIYEIGYCVWTKLTRLYFKLTKAHPCYLADTTEVPIILVHGYADSPMTWTYFLRRLRQANFKHIHTVSLKPVYGSIREIAKNLADDIAKIEQQYNTHQVHLIAHSMGGLVCAYYEAMFSRPNQVLSLNCIGTPWHGTVMTNFAYSENSKEMNYDSEFLNGLRSLLSGFVEKINLQASTVDTVIIPWHSTILADVDCEHHIYHRQGHAQLLYQQKVVDCAIKFINSRSKA